MAKSDTKETIIIEQEKHLPLWVRHVMFGVSATLSTAVITYYAYLSAVNG